VGARADNLHAAALRLAIDDLKRLLPGARGGAAAGRTGGRPGRLYYPEAIEATCEVTGPGERL
jgi:hypothetical protein